MRFRLGIRVISRFIVVDELLAFPARAFLSIIVGISSATYFSESQELQQCISKSTLFTSRGTLIKNLILILSNMSSISGFFKYKVWVNGSIMFDASSLDGCVQWVCIGMIVPSLSLWTTWSSIFSSTSLLMLSLFCSLVFQISIIYCSEEFTKIFNW